MTDQSKREERAARGVVTGDPLRQLPTGSELRIETLFPIGKLKQTKNAMPHNSLNTPNSVDNWDFFRGAVMGLLLRDQDAEQMVGNAFAIGPGIAITATHIVSDHLVALQNGRMSASCVCFRGETLQIWHVSRISASTDNDVAILSMSLNSDLPADNTFYKFGLTTRQPELGEAIQLFGYRQDSVHRKKDGVEVFAELLVSEGTVSAVYPYGRGKVMIPFSAIELECGVRGGMSGGIAIDKNGLIVGTISSSFETTDRSGPTCISWIVSAFARPFEMPWPPGVSKQSATLLSVNERLVFVDKRSAISFVNGRELWYRPWH